MPSPAVTPIAANLMLSLFDGSRQPFKTKTKVLVRVLDGNQKQLVADFFDKPNIFLQNLPFSDNLADNYTLIAFADGYQQAGFTPVPIKAGVTQSLDLMLVPSKPAYNFRPAKWESLEDGLRDLFAAGASTAAIARDRYTQLLENRPDSFAALLNITTALSQIQLAAGPALGFLKQLLWDEMAQDRFFALADPELIKQVERAVQENEFAPEFNPGFFHAGATRSFKELNFGEANVQLTFHENTTQMVKGVECVKVELDIDYFRDLLAHALLEVLPNSLSGGKTHPQQVYVLRWIASRRSGFPSFDPPYTLIKS